MQPCIYVFGYRLPVIAGEILGFKEDNAGDFSAHYLAKMYLDISAGRRMIKVKCSVKVKSLAAR
ncbi:hypothetical protein [Microcoleus sp. FACHB-672]|uniref:hypothetical protein n=1 Tax=Microcoleus sp. FACHB-672 TaxID=2692825 RepID=UPI001688DEFC|nr:hypothetical protein [Microcoleus sp. FACHB-672]